MTQYINEHANKWLTAMENPHTHNLHYNDLGFLSMSGAVSPLGVAAQMFCDEADTAPVEAWGAAGSGGSGCGRYFVTNFMGMTQFLPNDIFIKLGLMTNAGIRYDSRGQVKSSVYVMGTSKNGRAKQKAWDARDIAYEMRCYPEQFFRPIGERGLHPHTVQNYAVDIARKRTKISAADQCKEYRERQAELAKLEER